jgi:bacteriocin biosynthesis cyclodehydratase domain-containing protein
MNRLPLRPCLALPFTILRDRDQVRLIAGEDFRYTLTAPGLDTWLPDWLPVLDGRLRLDDALGRVPEPNREAARELVAQLYGERVLIDGPAVKAHIPHRFTLLLEGDGLLRESLPHADNQAPSGTTIPVLCQDTLDYDAALRFNRRCLQGPTPWLWLTCGPLQRGYLSPAFLPDAGPCLACLLGHFQRLSPVPDLYAALIEHAQQGRALTPSPFPARAATLLCDLLLWKAELLGEPDPPAALYRLHVLEVATLEITSHRVFVDSECPECRAHR